MKKWLMTFIILLNSFKNIIPQTNIATGKFPRAIDQGDETVLIIYDDGALWMTKEEGTINFDPHALKITANPITDKHACLFQLSKEKFVLLRGAQLIISVFKKKIEEPKSVLTTFAQHIGDSYQYSVISDTSFLIAWQTTTSYEVKIIKIKASGDIDLESGSKLSIPCTNPSCNGISCQYSPKENKIICAYGTPDAFTFNILTNVLVSLTTTIDSGFDNIRNPNLKLFKDSTFSFCFYSTIESSNKLECIKINLSTNNSIQKIPKVTVFNGNKLENINSHMLVHNEQSLFTIVTNGASIYINQLSSNIEILANTITGSTSSNQAFPTLFTLGKDRVGYTYTENEKIYQKVFIFPACEPSQTLTTQILNMNPISIFFPYKFDNKDPNTSDELVFYQIPKIALLQYNDINNNMEFVIEKKKYPPKSYLLTTYFEPGQAVISYRGLYQSFYSTGECQVTVTICYFTCKTCTYTKGTPPTYEDHQCSECLEDYKPISYKQSQCINETNKPKGHFLNVNDKVYEKCDDSCESCVENKTNCVVCTVGYYFKEDKKECVKGNIDGYVLIEGKYRKCYESCQSCSGPAVLYEQNCLTCKTNFLSDPFDNTQCYRKCSSIDTITSNTGVCISENKKCEDTNFPLLVDETSYCVKKCRHTTNPDCLPCQNKILFNYENKTCQTTCPGLSKSYPDNETKDNKCVPYDPSTENPNTHFKIYEEKPETNLPFSDFTFTDNTEFNKYAKILLDRENHNQARVDLIYHIQRKDYSLTFFNATDENIFAKVYNTTKVPSIDLTSLKFNMKRIIVMQWDISRQAINELTDQTNYVFYDFDTKDKANIDEIRGKPIMISSPIDFNNPLVMKTFEMTKKNINIYNQSSEFFNDVCFKYTDEVTQRDVTITDRREKIFEKKELCESNCTFVSFDEEKQRINCNCSFNGTFYRIIENPSNAFNQSKYETYNVLKCVNQVFNEKVTVNAAFWIFLFFLVTVVCLALCFMYSGMTYTDSYAIHAMKAKGLIIKHQNKPPFPCPPMTIDQMDYESNENCIGGGVEDISLKNTNIKNAEAELEQEKTIDL